MTKKILLVGDSKTYDGGNTWPASLVSNLNSATPGTTWSKTNLGTGGNTAHNAQINIDTQLAALSENHAVVLINLGVNDFDNATETAWKADILYVADAIHTKWPQTVVRMMRPWKRSNDATADTYAGWIADIIAARTFIVAGPDERTWLKGADDGATMTTDGIHYSAAGETECAAQWKSNLGY